MLLVLACGGRSPTTPTPPPGACTFAVSAGTVQFPTSGGTVTLHVDTAGACAWTVRASSNWIAVSPASGSGPADVVLTAGANDATAERIATVTIADKELPVRQPGRSVAPCSYSLSSPSSTFGADGGRGRVSVATAAGCAWTATSQASWLSLRVTTGTGPGEIEYDVAPFSGTQQRETRIAVEQTTFTIRQDPPGLAPCTYAVDPLTTSLHWHGAAGDGFDVHLTAAPHCTWTAAAGAPWMQLVTAGAGSGSTTIRTRIGAYTAETTRSAPLMIRWPTETAGQNVVISQEGCRYAVSLTTDTVAAAGGRRRVGVFGTPVSTTCSIGCPWTVVSNTSWIHIPGVESRAGDDDVFFDVDANTTGTDRVGTLTIAGFTVTVRQSWTN